MRVVLSALAELDLIEIGDWIARDSPANAVRFVRLLRLAINRIARMPTGYRLRPELGEGVRSCAVKSQVIFFRIEPGHVLVLRVLHGARDIGRSDVGPAADPEG